MTDTYLRYERIRALMTRLAEAHRLLREDGDAARRHLLRGLCEVLHADAAVWTCGAERVELGGPDGAAQARVRASLARGGFAEPGLVRLENALVLTVPGPGFVQRLALQRAAERAPFSDEDAGLMALLAGPSDFMLQPFAVEASRAGSPLTPRLRDTLRLLLTGLSEKQVADALQLSQHTVHGYVKELYQRMRVSSRAELLARCLA